MWRVWEEVKRLKWCDLISLGKHSEIAGLRNWIARQVNQLLWLDFVDSVNKASLTAGARWIKNDGAAWRDVACNVFGFIENASSVWQILGVVLHFLVGGTVNFDESETLVASDGKTDATDAGIEVEDFLRVDFFGDSLEC